MKISDIKKKFPIFFSEYHYRVQLMYYLKLEQDKECLDFKHKNNKFRLSYIPYIKK